MALLIIIALIILNGVFALTEMALVSVRKARLETRANDGDTAARRALDVANQPGRALSTIQIGITLVGILAGTFGGSALVGPLSAWLAQRIPPLAPAAEGIAVALVVGLTTYLSLVIGELVPKQLALQNAEAVAVAMARPLNMLTWAVRPAVWLLETSTNGLIWLLGIRASEDDTVTESEIITLVRQGVDVGLFDDAEEALVRNVMQLDDQRIAGFVTPRVDLVTIPINATTADIRKIVTEHRYTTYPVVDRATETVRGVARLKDILPHLIAGHDIPLEDVMRQPLFVPEQISAARLLRRFRQSGIHTAIVFDEYGSYTGLVRLHDLVEEIVGELDTGAFGGEQAAVTRRPDGSWLVDGIISLERFAGLFPGFRIPPDEQGRYATLAGFIMVRLERVPTVGDTFDYAGLHVEIVDMDGAHIDKVLVRSTAHPRPQVDRG